MSMRHCPSTRFSCIPFIFAGALAQAQSALVASPVDPDIPSPGFAPRPHAVDQEIKLAGNYFTGRGVAQDLKLSAYWYEKAAEAGDPEAQTQIGYFYEAGIGVQKDPVRAAHWYQLAAAGGLATAKVNLGTAYMLGVGVPKNQQTASELFHEAARKGSGLAACYIGYMHYFGDGVPQDPAAAEEWFVKGVVVLRIVVRDKFTDGFYGGEERQAGCGEGYGVDNFVGPFKAKKAVDGRPQQG